MSPLRLLVLTVLAMLAFAANSVLCRLALRDTAIDAASFTTLRIASGAVALGAIVAVRGGAATRGGNWISAAALFAYAAAFSFAYLRLPAGTGALLLFGAVQATMILWGWTCGERLRWGQIAGLALALVGLVGLVLPGIAAPPLGSAGCMIAAGIAWGVYSLRGRGAKDPLLATAGNFLRAVPFALVVSAAAAAQARWDPRGALYAVTSGAVTSGLGYAIWYAALRGLDATRAASVQLSVPVLAALAGILWLGEEPSLRWAISSLAVLGGIALVILAGKGRP